MPFELGRTLLVKGMIERRARRKSAARDVIRPGARHLRTPRRAALGGQGPPGAVQDRRRPPAGGLTETEHRIAALVAQGQTNREIAAAMFVTENTVQTHVRHIFQKLGVRSRTELAARLTSVPTSTATAAESPAG